MTKYEIMFIVKATMEEKKKKKTAEDTKKLINGNAYPIKKEVSGYYYVMNVETDHATIAEFDRKVRINENILRHLIIKMESE